MSERGVGATVQDLVMAVHSTSGIDLAQPPVGMVVNQTAAWALVIFSLLSLPGCIYAAIKVSRREGHLVVPTLMLAGAIFAFVEPVFDMIGGVWYPAEMPLRAATVFGRSVNWGVAAAYVFFFFATTYSVYEMMRRGRPLRDLLLFAAAFSLLDSVLEMGAAQFDIFVWYSYRGAPVAAILGLPIHMIFWNGLYAIFSGGLLFLAMPYVRRGWRVLLLVPGVIIVYGVALSLLAAPSVWAINNDVSDVVAWVCGVVSSVAVIAAALYVATLPPIVRLRAAAGHAPARVGLSIAEVMK